LASELELKGKAKKNKKESKNIGKEKGRAQKNWSKRENASWRQSCEKGVSTSRQSRKVWAPQMEHENNPELGRYCVKREKAGL